MRIKSIDAFEKHLVQSLPEHRSCIYLLLLEDSFERGYYVEKIYRFLKREKPDLILERGEEALSTLFSLKDRVIWIDEPEDLEALAREVSQLGAKETAIVTSSKLDKKNAHRWEEIAIVVDLLEEKMWERKERFYHEANALVKKEKKSIDKEVLSKLVDRSSSFAFLKHEMEKIFCYVGEESVISLKAVEEISCREEEETFWEAAEILLLRGERRDISCKDLSQFLTFLWQLRYYLGLLREWKVKEVAPKELKGARRTRFQKRVQEKDLTFFMRLEELFLQVEVQAKSGCKGVKALLEELVIGTLSIA